MKIARDKRTFITSHASQTSLLSTSQDMFIRDLEGRFSSVFYRQNLAVPEICLSIHVILTQTTIQFRAFRADEPQISFSSQGGPAREPDVCLLFCFFFLIRPNTNAKYALQYNFRNKSGQFREKKKKKNRSRWLRSAGEDVIDENHFLLPIRRPY